MLKCCFFGLGSIGLRHLKNLTDIAGRKGLEISVDAFRSSAKSLDNEAALLIGREISEPAELAVYDIAFITNPTSLHFETIAATVDKTRHMYIEKPLFESGAYDLQALNLKEGSIYHVACPLRFNPVINYVKDYLRTHQVFSARAMCSSYLPDWRPGRDYREIYSAAKKLGGGVTLDLIHELDYLTYLFGFPLEIANIKGKFSNLEIDSDDLSIYIIRYADKAAELHLDYFGRVSARYLELYTEDELITADMLNNKVIFNQEKKEINFAPENVHYREMEYFLDLVINQKKSFNDITLACKVLALAEGKIK
jgi:predicted dehydrogenase